MDINKKMRQENLTNKAIKIFQKEYYNALNKDWVYKPLSYALYQTWKYFNAIEQSRYLNTEKGKRNETKRSDNAR